MLVRAAVSLALAGAVAGNERIPSSAEAPEWRVLARAPPTATAGQPVRIELEVVARGGYHVNEEYPLNFRPSATPEAPASKPRFTSDDGLVLERCPGAEKHACLARLPATFVPRKPGRVSLGGTLAFSVCDPERCLIKKVPLAVEVDVARQ